MKKFHLSMKILFHITLVLYVIFAVVGPILLNNSSIVNSVLGVETSITTGGGAAGSTYYDTNYKTMAEVHEASRKIIERTMGEGAVLLKNDGALPLSEGDAVTLYGAASHYSVHSGQGSSGIEDDSALSDRVSFLDGLRDAGLQVNTELDNWYGTQSKASALGGSDDASSKDNFMGGSKQQSQYVVKDIAWDSLPEAKNTPAKAAIVVFARNSGEAVDLYMDTTMDDGATRVLVSKSGSSVGDALTLSANEQSILRGLKSLKDNHVIDSIVVLFNMAAPMQGAFLDDEAYGIDAAMWVGTLGSTGAAAVGKLLTGEYNPSGRASDTFFAESKYNPVYYNFGNIAYGDASRLSIDYKDGNNRYYAVYQEGIYNGYKYTETRYEDYVLGQGNAGEFDYAKAVSYPFGYGLSYSEFTYSDMQVTDNGDGTYTVTVNVSNTSEADGKEVVQVYLQKPYTAKDVQNGVEKAAVELIGFTKVEVPAGETVSAEITVEEKYFAAYDANVEKTFVIGSENAADEYLLTAAKNSHDAVNNILQYKQGKGISVQADKMVSSAGDGEGNAALVWGKHFDYDAEKYSTNEIIERANENFTPRYEGEEANWGVSSITNQFDDVDFQKAGIFSEAETRQSYMSRSDWTGTYGKRITLTATDELAEAQKVAPAPQDSIPYPTYGKTSFFESGSTIDEIKLIYLRDKSYDDPLWEQLLDRITWEDTCGILQDALRYTNAAESIAAPSSSQQNGALAPVHSRPYSQLPSQSGFRGFAEELDPANKSQLPAVFVCNGIVASTFNTELIEEVGEQTGEEAAWAGFNGIYGLGVNIHRGAYCGRQFEYYSEDGFLTGMAAGHEAVGLHKLGVFVLMKHAVLNDQESHRAGLNVWANEQSIREIYCRAIEVAISLDIEKTPRTMLGVMTGMNRMGATWTGAQGFCNTVLRAEYGMRGYAISDYNSSRLYMSPIAGVLYGNDLPDGEPADSSNGIDKDGNDLHFAAYETGHGLLAWKMRDAVKNVLYTVVNSNTMNGITGDVSVITVVPMWEKAVPVVIRTTLVVFIWCAALYVASWIYLEVTKNDGAKSGAKSEDEEKEKE